MREAARGNSEGKEWGVRSYQKASVPSGNWRRFCTRVCLGAASGDAAEKVAETCLLEDASHPQFR